MQLMLTEIEVVHWAVLLQKIEVHRHDQPKKVAFMLQATAIMTKKTLVPESEFKVFDSFMQHNYARNLPEIHRLITSTHMEQLNDGITIYETNSKFAYLFNNDCCT